MRNAGKVLNTNIIAIYKIGDNSGDTILILRVKNPVTYLVTVT